MNVPSPHLEIGTCLIDVFHQDLTPFVYKGTFFFMTNHPGSERSWVGVFGREQLSTGEVKTVSI